MQLANLLPPELAERLPERWRNIAIDGLAYDSRACQPNALFAAWRGARSDGHAHIAEARARGAAFVLAEQPLGADVPHLQVADAQVALGLAASRFYAEATSPLTLIGITGTNGKTTCVHLVASMLAAAHGQAAAIGTLGLTTCTASGDLAIEPLPGGLTTPQSSDLHAALAALSVRGYRHVAIEATSIALSCGRLAGLQFDVAAMTNLSRDHLDFHGSMSAYQAAKTLLFSAHRRGKRPNVFNADDACGRALAAAYPPCLTFSAASPASAPQVSAPAADVAIGRVELGRASTTLTCRTPRGVLQVASALVGDFNVDNLLLAVAVGESLALPPEAMAQGLRQLRRVPGRLERVVHPAGPGGTVEAPLAKPASSPEAAVLPLVLVDFAHTPAALARACAAARQLAGQGRLFCLFGCGGDRDAGKRAPMGGAAVAHADWCIVTSDNPRTESPEAIVADVVAGCRSAGAEVAESPPAARPPPGQPGGYCVEPDRRVAIARIVAAAHANDTVLLAGKGHEPYQIVGTRKLPFDDREQAALALQHWHQARTQRPSLATRSAMVALPIETLANVVGAACPPALLGKTAHGLAIDSRKLQAGELFVALPGAGRDGHDFLPQAQARGMQAAIVSQAWAATPQARALPGPASWLAVPEPMAALGQIGRYARAQRAGPVVGVTGSNGKTTSKELLAAALGGRGPVHKTAGNLNNHLGVPITLAAWPKDAWAAVVEMGMSAPNEIAALAAIARPEVGLVTCVAAAHLAHFSSLGGIAAAKAELFAGLPANGVVVLNADDGPLCLAADAVRGSRPVLRFGRRQGADVQLQACQSGIGPAGEARLQLTVAVGGHSYDGELPLLGAHNALNAAGAVAAAWALGVAPDEALAGMASVALPAARLKLTALAADVRLIDDCYNANPGSVRASLAVLGELAHDGRSVAVLGDMLELGPTAAELHETVGRAAAEQGISLVLAVGRHAEAVAAGVVAGGGQAQAFAEVAGLAAALPDALRAGDTWLIKGSRGMRLERIVELMGQVALQGQANGG